MAGTPLGERALPGIIAGAADLDPAAVLTATVAGATYGTSVGWVVLVCIPILQSVFGVAARIGHETKLGLIKLIREHFGVRIAVTIACMVALVNVTMIIAGSAVVQHPGVAPTFWAAKPSFRPWVARKSWRAGPPECR